VPLYSSSPTVVAVSHVTCFTLHRSVFNEVIDRNSSLIETSNSALTHTNSEVSSFAKHVKLYTIGRIASP
jgi:hypothetical protein